MPDGWTLKRRYRKTSFGYVGEVFACPPFVDAFVDDVKPRRVDSFWRLTERGIRRALARNLWRRTHPPTWTVRGRV